MGHAAIPDSAERRRLAAGDSMAVYSAGHFLFGREGVLMAQPFDTGRLQLHRDSFPVVQGYGKMVAVSGDRGSRG